MKSTKRQNVGWGSLEPKPTANPKTFVLTGNEPPLVKGVPPQPQPVKKKPVMSFKKGGVVKGKKSKGKRYF